MRGCKSTIAVQVPSTWHGEAMALPLIWEIDRQDVEARRVIFTTPDDQRRGHRLDGLGLLGRHGCGVELSCFDPEGMRLLDEQPIAAARLRIPRVALRDCHLDPSRGQVVLLHCWRSRNATTFRPSPMVSVRR